jgi:hypothetical protein
MACPPKKHNLSAKADKSESGEAPPRVEIIGVANYYTFLKIGNFTLFAPYYKKWDALSTKMSLSRLDFAAKLRVFAACKNVYFFVKPTSFEALADFGMNIFLFRERKKGRACLKRGTCLFA